MNTTFDRNKKEDRNLVAKLRNTVSDMNFYCYRFLLRDGFDSSPRTGISDAERLIAEGVKVPSQIHEILNRFYHLQKNSTPKNANELFYRTWIFLHDFDNFLKNGI